jgi:hypothetical protein
MYYWFTSKAKCPTLVFKFVTKHMIMGLFMVPTNDFYQMHQTLTWCSSLCTKGKKSIDTPQSLPQNHT